MLFFAAALAAMTVIDGDTLRNGRERIRLVGIDAPELHGCPRNRTCAPGDGQASKRSLGRLTTGRIRIERIGKDRYGRTLAHVYANGRNLACEQLRAGQAVYKPRWDNGRSLAKQCRYAR